MRFLVRSLASLSGLRIRCCRELWCRSQMWLGSHGAVVVVERKQIRLGTMRLWVRSLASLSGLRIQRCRELCCRLAAVALIRPLAWELPYFASVAIKRKKKGNI